MQQRPSPSAIEPTTKPPAGAQSEAGDEGAPAERNGLTPPRSPQDNALNRLKAQRNEAREEAAFLRRDLDSIRNEMQAMRAEFQGARPNGHAKPEEISAEDLLRFATDEQTVAEKPHVAINAAIKYTHKLLGQERDRLRQEILDEVLGKMQRQKDEETTYAEIIRNYGADATNAESDLFLLADKKYRALQNKYGNKEVDANPSFKRMVFAEAARELGHPQGGLSMSSTPETNRRGPATPPPETHVETKSEGDTSDYLARSKAAIDRGEPMESLRLKSKNLFPE